MSARQASLNRLVVRGAVRVLNVLCLRCNVCLCTQRRTSVMGAEVARQTKGEKGVKRYASINEFLRCI